MANLNGTWYNELGSVMTIEVTGNNITGTYQTRVGDAKGTYNLCGQTDIDNDSTQAIGWVVVWQNEYGSSDSVTTWSGQMKVVNEIPTIVTTWLLTEETNPSDEWRSTLIGKDIFTNVQKSEGQIKSNFEIGLKLSFPKKK